MATATLRIGIAPSKNNPDLPRAHVTADGLEIGTKAPHVVFTTEMGDQGRDYADFRRGLGAREYRAAKNTVHTENPIIFDATRMKQGPSSSVKVKTPGYPLKAGKGQPTAYYYEGTSPTRSDGIAQLWPRNQQTGLAVQELAAVYIGGHRTAFAKSGHYDHDPKRKHWCVANWNANQELEHDLIADAHRAGHLVFLGSDFNCPLGAIPTFGKGQRWLISGGIDGVLVVPAPRGKGPKCEFVSRTGVVDVWSDHHYRQRTVRLVSP